MGDAGIYYIRVRGLLAAGDIEPFSPPGLHIAPLGEEGSLLSVCTDQAGVIGLIRSLHGMGIILQALERQEFESRETE
ncbi:MAG: hypothetical protein GYA17_05950 [Chloroflexi bacterium]|jgi:hypothetical protein|nr:hypothetical protein [Anaerolineaceae bacterium]NMB87881.1 hypothetical protein [Chloroflexota bacterium]